jgi:hypothetical protein
MMVMIMMMMTMMMMMMTMVKMLLCLDPTGAAVDHASVAPDRQGGWFADGANRMTWCCIQSASTDH